MCVCVCLFAAESTEVLVIGATRHYDYSLGLGFESVINMGIPDQQARER